MTYAIVWHRRDLRTRDNHALHKASQKAIPVPIFVIDPFFFRDNNETCNDRILFMFECLEDLKEQYKAIGSELTILYGKTPARVEELAQELNAQVYYNQDTNMPFGFRRDKQILRNKQFTACSNDAIIREEYNRAEWRKNCKEYFQEKQHPKPKKLTKPPLIQDEIRFEELIKKHNITKTKQLVAKGGSKEAHKKLGIFLKHIHEYPKSISSPNAAREGCSGISAHLSLGAIGIREVYQRTIQETKPTKARNFYLSRIYWNQHFTQKLQDFPQLTTTAVNPIYKHQGSRDERKIIAWKQGKTGYPLVDASMRCLKQTGWLNFRMRAMVASFFCDILNQPWQIGADYMHYHLIDADTAINYAQWQMQAGVVGAHPPRIYNPTKQAKDQDPQGTFIKQWVEELTKVPPQYIAEPHKISHLRQQQYGLEAYPKPIVDYTKEMRRARKNYQRTNPYARKALNNPQIRKRASLSQARKHKKKKDANQQSLSTYS